MLRTKLLFLSLVVYVSGQGVSYYGGSNVRTQNQLPDSNRPAYTPNAQPIRPVYNPQPVYQSPQPVQSDQPIYQQLQNQPGVSQPSPVRRPPQLTFGSIIPDPQEYIPEPAITKKNPPKPIYSIPPQPATNPLTTWPINSYPRTLQPWSWGSARPTEAREEIIQENPSPPNNAQEVYPKSLYAPSFGSKAIDVESLTEPAPLPALVEEPAVELQPEAETDIPSSLPESSQPDIQVNTQQELPEPAIPESFSEIELHIPRPSPPSYPDLRPTPEEPSIDTIYEPLSSPEPIPISNQQPSANIPLVPRPLPSPGLVVFPEPQPTAPELAIPVQPPPPIDAAPSQPSYQPKEPVKPEASAPVNMPPRPNYQPVLPPRPSYEIPAPISIPVPRPPQPQPIPTYPVPPTLNIPVPAPDVPPIIAIADFQCSKGTAYYTIINECDAYIKCQRQRAWKHTCPDGLHFNPRASYPEYPCAYPSEVKCESTAFKQIAQPTNECPNRYGFFPLSEDCSRYLMCQEGKATLMNCPFGLVFNNELSSCDWPENVPQCHLSAFKDFTCPIPPEDDPDLLSRHRYGNECRLYVACQHGHPRLLSCDSGLSFDENSQVCIDSDLVKDCRYEETNLYNL